jgi:isopentenyl diphosphate isomerase/L-lactate dehydrogenase-like FMN-dependent dehydrogenase
MAVDTSVELLGKRLKVPLLISPMTGEQACALSGAEVKALAPGQAQLAEARARLTGYCQTLQQRYGEHLRLRSYTVVSLGFDRLAWKEV